MHAGTIKKMNENMHAGTSSNKGKSAISKGTFNKKVCEK